VAVVRLTDRPVVVTAVPLTAAARDRLARGLGDVDVHDIRDDVLAADLVITPSCSPQAVAALKRAYPSARLVVVELEDGEFDVRLAGPVKRLRNAGADAYLTADSLDDLAAQLRSAPPAPPADRAPDELPESSVDALILTDVKDLLHRRAHR
jgi:hypothetical protein